MRRSSFLAPGLLCLCAVTATGVPSEATELISVTTKGKAGENINGGGFPDSTPFSVSRGATGPEGLAIAFESKADNFTSQIDDNGLPDIYLQAGGTSLVSQGTDGKAGNGASRNPAMLQFGPSQWAIAFESDADNLIEGYEKAGVNSKTQIIVALSYGGLGLVTISKDGPKKGAVGDASDPTFGIGGLAFTWSGYVTNLADLTGVTDHNKSGSDILVLTGSQLSIVSAPSGSITATGDGSSTHPELSTDGACVLFESTSKNLAGNVTNTFTNIYLRMLQAKETYLVSSSPSGDGASAHASNAHVSTDCGYVVFESAAKNLHQAGIEDKNNKADVFLWSKSTKSLA